MYYCFVQGLLKKRFSNSKPFQKKDRAIPKFRGKIISSIGAPPD